MSLTWTASNEWSGVDALSQEQDFVICATARDRYILASKERQQSGSTLDEFLRDMVRKNSVRLASLYTRQPI
jgi:hypothetical protein